MRRPGDRRARYGPNADDVVDLLETLERLSATDVLALAAAAGLSAHGEPGELSAGAPGELPAGTPDPRLAAARARLRALAESHGRIDALRAVGDEVADWAASLVHWFPAGVAGGSEARSEIPPRMAALPVVLDAAYATVMEDLLAEEDTDLLCAAWDEAVPDADEPDADWDDDPDPDAGRPLDGEAEALEEPGDPEPR